MRNSILLSMLSYLAFCCMLFQCKESKSLVLVKPEDPALHYSGRVHPDETQNMELISSASSVSFGFFGDSVCLLLKNVASTDEYNYVTVVIDQQVLGRFPIKGKEVVPLGFRLDSRKRHQLQCVKATEAINGRIVVCGVEATKLSSTPEISRQQILFIGNSITCGMGADITDIPCESGKWYDQHDAYFAYGPRVARQLGADYVLNSVSGIGIYRQWNTDGPAMPAVYDHLYFDTTSTVTWDDHRVDPQIISIALGTNDLSSGDGIHPRPEFDSTTFITSYVDFAHRLYRKYPEARFVLLSSPMESGAKARILEECLTTIKQKLDGSYPERFPVTTYFFTGVTDPAGCGGHPDDEDHAEMAKELIPVFRQLLDH